MANAETLKRAATNLRRDEVRYRNEALREASERTRADRIEVHKMAHELIKVQGVSPTTLVRETGFSRATIYRWVNEHERMSDFASEGRVAAESSVDESMWTDTRLMGTGEVVARDADGDLWVLDDGGGAWNKTQNKNHDGFDSWPDGARDVFDRVRSEK